jgi:adenylate cyclase
MSLEIEREFMVAEGRRDARLMTVKTFDAASGALVRQEVEFEIGDAVFAELPEPAGGDRLSKYRWSVPLEHDVATVDEYDGSLAGLRVVEVDSVEEARNFQPPDWFGEEATGSPALSNRERAAPARAVLEEQGETR